MTKNLTCFLSFCHNYGVILNRGYIKEHIKEIKAVTNGVSLPRRVELSWGIPRPALNVTLISCPLADKRMYKNYFPSCKTDGPIEPSVPFNHLGISGAVPKKCSECKHLFEGSCTRYIDEVGRYLYLDHGPCGINGPTDPVQYESEFFISKVEIPRKCSKCVFLKIDRNQGFYCGKDKEKWGQFPRGLDWGAWEPNSIYLELPLPKVTSKKLSIFARQNDQLSFIKEYRRINPGLSLKVAKEDFAYFRQILEKSANNKMQLVQ